MPPRKKIPAPIDRPLARAYLRQFTGWSTAYPPGQSEPTSLRVMENMFVDRNGALAVRPGLKYLSYTRIPNGDPENIVTPGLGLNLPIVGTLEPFYTNDDKKALLFAVREVNGTVGFRVLLFTNDGAAVVRTLTDADVGFTIPQGETAIQFSEDTTYVKYLQIDNKIIALSDNPRGEDMRLFYVGAEKRARRIGNISVPLWEDSHKLKVVHPDYAWIADQEITTRRNNLINPSFEIGGQFWSRSPNSSWASPANVGTTISGVTKGQLKSLPTRTNMIHAPLHAVSGARGIAGWNASDDYPCKVSKDGAYLKVYDSQGDHTFLAYGAKMTFGVAAGQKYVVALDYDLGTNVTPYSVLTFYNTAGAIIGSRTYLTMPKKKGRFVSAAVTAPTGTVSMRLSLGGKNESKSNTFVKFANIVVCKSGESTAIFSGDNTGTPDYYFWEGTENASPSTYHPPVDISLTSNRTPVAGGAPINGSIYVWTAVTKNYDFRVRTYDKDATLKQQYLVSGATNDGTGWVRINKSSSVTTVEEVSADVQLTFKAVPRGHTVYADAALLEYGVAGVGAYFDGSTVDTATVTNNWANNATPHKTISIQSIKAVVPVLPAAETPTAKTLIASGGAINNPYKIGFFYTFENEVGESAPSKITEVRTSRPWSNWVWQKPNNLGEPDPTLPTETAELCADQLVASIPSVVFDQAVKEGALKWNLYAFAWSDQEPVPVVAQLVNSRELYADDTSALMEPRSALYDDKGWIQVTPARRIGLFDSILPTRTNRVNYSRPPQASNGLVAGDRLILVGDPIDLALIRWSSKQPGGYTNFSLNRGGGTKTLTSGNLNIPVSVVLWQNPQSVDTLTILCQTGDGQSNTYYMNPAEVGAQTATTQIMGFEETTSTPGTTAPHGNEVLNNALWRPTDRALLKSTAQNYNISHKTVSDKIANVWWRLTAKNRITSARLDNRLYYLVYNPEGELLEKDCRGNEIWVYDVSGGEEGHWARLLIQGSALRVFSLGDREYMGITRPGGVFYLDPEVDHDEYVVLDGADPKYLQVLERPIPWRFETNTQGANRAHDAWAHLQQIQVTLGNFRGKMKYGIRAHDVNHQDIDVHKVVSDLKPGLGAGSTWDIDDILQIRRDLKEWVFYGSSIDGEISFGHIGYVQYRYAPISVNIGYELGSVETFEYGSNVADGASIYSDNGIPLPIMDYSRP